MSDYNMILRDCVVIYKDNYGKHRIISMDIPTMLSDWSNNCEYCCEDDAPILYASIFGTEVKCKTFKKYMELIGKISAEVCG